jgi:hypothetical protein
MKKVFLIIRSSLLLSVIFSASMFTLVRILLWIIDFEDLTKSNLLGAPIIGGLIGLMVYIISKKREKII